MIIPYRDRPSHIKAFLVHYKSFPIVVIEQDDNEPFNRGWLLNIGFLLCDADEIIAHDVDMLCSMFCMGKFHASSDYPVHYAGKASQFGYRMPFPGYFGGVVKFTREQFESVGGFSNNFAGWGGEDNELYERCIKTFGQVTYNPCYMRSLPHEPAPYFCLPPDHPNYILWKKGRGENDGVRFTSFSITGTQTLLEPSAEYPGARLIRVRPDESDDRNYTRHDG